MNPAVIALFAAVSGCTPARSGPPAEAARTREKVLHSFGDGTDGVLPHGILLDVNGTLYGTTSEGGASDAGTLFALDPDTGKETLLHSFDYTDGGYPDGGLIDVKGMLYGTTYFGGSGGCGTGCGTVFAFDPGTGAEQVLHSFGVGTDGEYPDAGLVAVNGMLYGTTRQGGTGLNGSGRGTVFAIDRKTGAETVLYSFCSQGGQYCTDGALPQGDLIDVNGILYGTTTSGGANCEADGGCGTLFSLDPESGAETVVYSFCRWSAHGACTDGWGPFSGLVNVQGKLYGTTVSGGSKGGWGTVYSFDTITGKERVLHSFSDANGAYPYAGVIDASGMLYGTTPFGGRNGGGTVYSVDPNSGATRVVYSFPSCNLPPCPNGSEPLAGVIAVNDMLYGTTLDGGTANLGTAFRVRP
ncbi:MAG TPA: choice-of-anchor tandem repeat GloVer-containing protein [Rhizomicrobium sp.]|jgi:uncharacterized repeat protein (TIGR03803 family)|nr:choice-of-anchor tandem repeat GloVer-containing protein [Rhizomicrobium sp.]